MAVTLLDRAIETFEMEWMNGENDVEVELICTGISGSSPIENRAQLTDLTDVERTPPLRKVSTSLNNGRLVMRAELLFTIDDSLRNAPGP